MLWLDLCWNFKVHNSIVTLSWIPKSQVHFATEVCTGHVKLWQWEICAGKPLGLLFFGHLNKFTVTVSMWQWALFPESSEETTSDKATPVTKCMTHDDILRFDSVTVHKLAMSKRQKSLCHTLKTLATWTRECAILDTLPLRKYTVAWHLFDLWLNCEPKYVNVNMHVCIMLKLTLMPNLLHQLQYLAAFTDCHTYAWIFIKYTSIL